MPLRKIADAPPPPCTHPEHSPPSMIVLEPGTYEHTCPRCGARATFTVDRVTCVGGSMTTIEGTLYPGSTVRTSSGLRVS
jgi:hypothetical protein